MSLGLAFLQATTGVFFVTTGSRKLFVPKAHVKASQLFTNLGVPWAFWPAVLGEFLGGWALVTGILPRIAAAGLLVIMLGAYRLDIWPAVWAKRDGSISKLVSNALCTPEAQLILILTALVIGG